MLSLAMAAGLTNAAITPIASASDRYGTIAVSCRPLSTPRPPQSPRRTGAKQRKSCAAAAYPRVPRRAGRTTASG